MTQGQELAGKVVLVTGASRGIGYAAAREAARRGAHVIAVARTIGGLEELDDDIQELGATATLVPLDIHLSRGFVKVTVAIARGQKEYDKRDKIKQQSDQREIRQAVRRASDR